MKTLVINLARAERRLENFLSCNSSILEDIERVEAIDGQLMDDEQQYLAPLISVMHEAKKFNVRAMSACFMSHIRCAEIIVERNLPYALICEDDAQALPEVAELIAAYERSPLPFDWIRLHAHREAQRDRHHKQVGASLGGIDLVVDMDGSKSNASYILTNAGARKVRGMQRMIAPPDYLEWHHGTQGVVFVQTRRNVFRIASELGSDISPNRGALLRRIPSIMKVEMVRRLVGRKMLQSNLHMAQQMAAAMATGVNPASSAVNE
jgi:glycosyl transferase family 25